MGCSVLLPPARLPHLAVIEPPPAAPLFLINNSRFQTISNCFWGFLDPSILSWWGQGCSVGQSPG